MNCVFLQSCIQEQSFISEYAMNLPELEKFDREHVWHPYTSMRHPPVTFPVASAFGTRLTLADGRTLIDGVSSWWSACHGYNHPAINQALHRQLDQLPHVMFGGLTHQPAVELAARLLELAPEGLTKLFFADSGSISVEVAIKMAMQYQLGSGRAERRRLLTVRGGYHGDTLGTMALCDPTEGMHAFFGGVLAEHFFAPAPACPFEAPCREKDIAELAALLERHQHEIAAVILEPVLQGAGGMRIYSPQYLVRLRELCDRYDILLILDEIATGFGRTGRLFAAQYAGIAPDIMCVGKGLTGGFLTLAATLCSDRVAAGIAAGPVGALMHGPTFMANALASAAALASLKLFGEYDWQSRVKAIERQLKTELAAAVQSPAVKEVRVLGAVGVIEMRSPVDAPALQQFSVDHGVWLRPFGSVIYTMPQFVIEPEELSRITAVMCLAAAAEAAKKPERSFC